MRRVGSLGAAAFLALVSSCIPSEAIVYSASVSPSAPAEARALLDGRTPIFDAAPHVILISIDGLRPDAIRRYGADNIQRLVDEGSYSFAATTITPSITLPSHTSMLTGALPAVHGITWNDNRVADRGRVPVPTIFQVAHEHGFATAAFASKGKFNHLFSPTALDYYVVPQGNGSWSSDRTATNVASYLRDHRPNLMFVHLPEPDRYGHVFGWMSFVYGIAVRSADAAVGKILDAADEEYGEGNYTVILTADHGGEGREHGDSAPLDRTIPWIAWGRDVARGELPEGIHTTDTAATVLWLLGTDAPASVAGSPVKRAFDGERSGHGQVARSDSPSVISDVAP